MIDIEKIKFGDDLTLCPIKQDGEKYYVNYYGSISAGFPSPADDFVKTQISIDEKYLSKPHSTFVLVVGGLSLFPVYEIGDIVIIRSDYSLLDGDDVAISINGSEFTLKRYSKKTNTFVSLNKAFPDIIVNEETDTIAILGIADAFMRDTGRKRRLNKAKI